MSSSERPHAHAHAHADSGPNRNPLLRTNSEPLPERPPTFGKKSGKIRRAVTFQKREFDTSTLPIDLQRVYEKLVKSHGETYALHVVFVIRTATELHRAWHMTLLTHKILYQLKATFGLVMTWDLGVILLKFRINDGQHELHRKVPYDYDSEFQDLYMKIATSLVEGRITINEALIYQAETKMGKHTARSGLFLRDFPGRLVLYPAVSSTCAIIFFGGDWADAGVAAACGLGAGMTELILGRNGAPLLVDIMVGIVTGLIGGLFMEYTDHDYCLSSIFLGTLYWFFYGTAFVIGLLEIVSGELETGVTRFIAVSVKTFVLTLGSTIGLLLAIRDSPFETWWGQDGACNTINLDDQWWRVPLYLLCSAAVLGQYRFPIIHYWRGLVVQLVGYEVQYRMFSYFAERHARDFLDTAVSNILGCMASVVTASLLSYVVDQLGAYYSARLLQRGQDEDDITASSSQQSVGKFFYSLSAGYVRLSNFVGLGRKSSLEFLSMENRLKEQAQELKDPSHPRTSIVLSEREESILLEAIIDAENTNTWSLLMPAVYQLVPGSLIAKLWYNAIFPPPLIQTQQIVVGTDFSYTDNSVNPLADDVFYGLMVISTSLALGLLLGFAVVQFCTQQIFPLVSSICCAKKLEGLTEEQIEAEQDRVERRRFRQHGVMNMVTDDDPDKDDQRDPVLTRQGSSKLGKTLGMDRLARIKELEQNLAANPAEVMEQRVMDIVQEEEHEEDDDEDEDPRSQPNERATSAPSIQIAPTIDVSALSPPDDDDDDDDDKVDVHA